MTLLKPIKPLFWHLAECGHPFIIQILKNCQPKIAIHESVVSHNHTVEHNPAKLVEQGFLIHNPYRASPQYCMKIFPV